jgi:hypothetical protein
MRRHIIRPRRLWGFQMHAERIKISIPVSIKTCMTPITLWLQGIDDDRVFAVTHARLRLGRENDWGMRDEVWGAVFGMQSMRSRLFLMRCAVDGVSGENWFVCRSVEWWAIWLFAMGLFRVLREELKILPAKQCHCSAQPEIDFVVAQGVGPLVVSSCAPVCMHPSLPVIRDAG